MIKRKITFILCLAFITIPLIECKKKDKGEEDITPESTFDKAAMLSNIADNIILPAYQNLKLSVDSLYYFNNLFVLTPTLTNLENLQTHFLQAYKCYQWVSPFEFGPAENEWLRANFNTFPCDTSQINSKITTGDLTFPTTADIDVKGFPALDFLLYRNNLNNNEVLAKYTADADAANAKKYLTVIINELKNKTDAVNIGWSSYTTIFKDNTGSNVGSSLGLLINQMDFDFEIIKNYKIGVPLGKQTMGAVLPNKVEALYSKKSLFLVIENLKCIENIYLGRSVQNIDGSGLDDYISCLKTQHSLGPLNDVIKNKFTSIKTKLAAITETLSQSVLSNATAVDAAYIELQQMVVLLKVDMPSALGVMITYEDNDGD